MSTPADLLLRRFARNYQDLRLCYHELSRDLLVSALKILPKLASLLDKKTPQADASRGLNE